MNEQQKLLDEIIQHHSDNDGPPEIVIRFVVRNEPTPEPTPEPKQSGFGFGVLLGWLLGTNL